MRELVPLNGWIVVMDPPAEEQTQSGLILPASVDSIAVAIVVSTGIEDVELSESQPQPFVAIFQLVDNPVKRGSLVYYLKGNTIEIRDQKLVRLSDLVAVEADA
jgi:co-chaperonin GroES (HSP10)